MDCRKFSQKRTLSLCRAPGDCEPTATSPPTYHPDQEFDGPQVPLSYVLTITRGPGRAWPVMCIELRQLSLCHKRSYASLRTKLPLSLPCGFTRKRMNMRKLGAVLSLVSGLSLASAAPALANGFASYRLCGGNTFQTCAAV